MPNFGQTVFRFTGALLLAAGATRIDQPRRLDTPVASRKIAMVPVVVAAKDIPGGVTIDRTALVVAEWPAGTQPAGAYTTVDLVAGRVTRVAVYKGQAIVPGRLAAYGARATPEVRITPGKRAYGIRINDVARMAGIVQPNSRVDILVVIDDPANTRKRVAKLFLSNMRVLAIAAAPERAQDGRPAGASVTLEVTPDEAERIALAASQGQLQIVLRGYGDSDSISPKGDVRDLLLRKSGDDARFATEAARPRARQP